MRITANKLFLEDGAFLITDAANQCVCVWLPYSAFFYQKINTTPATFHKMKFRRVITN